MSQEQRRRPITYGDVFKPVAEQKSSLASEPVKPADAAMMQSAEAHTFGHSLKSGAAATMQSAAAKNVQAGFVEKDSITTKVAEKGVGIAEEHVPGAVLDVEFVAGQPVFSTARREPSDPVESDAVTIGEALEVAALAAGDKPIDNSDVRAIESAESRATGHSGPLKGGIAASAQLAAKLNREILDDGEKTTLSDVLMDAKAELPSDKVVTYDDAYRVLKAEMRGRNPEDIPTNGVAAALVVAADHNAAAGLIPPPSPPIAVKLREKLDTNADRDISQDLNLDATRRTSPGPLEPAGVTSQAEVLPSTLGGGPVSPPAELTKQNQGELQPSAPGNELPDEPLDLASQTPAAVTTQISWDNLETVAKAPADLTWEGQGEVLHNAEPARLMSAGETQSTEPAPVAAHAHSD